MAWVLDFSGVGWVGWRGLRSVCIGVNSREELKPEASHRNCCPQAKGVIPGKSLKELQNLIRIFIQQPVVSRALSFAR